MTVLCVSENLYTLHEIVSSLQGSGYAVVTSCSYQRAVDLAAAEKVEIIVLASEKMHELMGIPATLKFLRPDIPIILMCRNLPTLPPGADVFARGTHELVPCISSLLQPTCDKA